MRRPLLALALAWGIGIILAGLFSTSPALPLLLAPAVALLFGFALSGQQAGGRGLLLALALAMALAGFLRANLSHADHARTRARLTTLSPPFPTPVRGTLKEAFVRFAPDRWRARIRNADLWEGNHWVRLPGELDVQVLGGKQPEGGSGDLLHASGRWLLGGRPSHALLGASGFPNTLETTGSVRVADNRFQINPNSSPSALERVVRARDNWRQTIRMWMLENLSPTAGPLALAMTTGDRGWLPEETYEALLRSGLLHLTAISGLNVTVALLVLPLLFKLVGVKRRHRALLGIPLACLLLALVGGQVSVMRATLVGVILMLGTFQDRPSDSLNLLGGAALAILVPLPGELGEPGFLLSFVTVAALLMWGPGRSHISRLRHPLETLLQKRISPFNPLYSGLISLTLWLILGLWASAVATLATLPISAWFFHTFAWKGIFGNLIAVPLAEIITVLGILAAFGLAFVPGLGGLLAGPLNFLCEALAAWGRWIADLPFGFSRILPLDAGPLALIAAFFLVLALPRAWFGGRVLTRRLVALFLLALLSWWPLLPARAALRVHFLDVGQGDASLLQFPSGQNLLIDAGPPSILQPGRTGRLVHSLTRLGVRRIDALVISHTDMDHVGGLEELLARVPVSAVIASGDHGDNPVFQRIATTLVKAGVPTERVISSDRIDGIPSTDIEVLNPDLEDLLFQRGKRNDRSVVLLVEHRGLRLLFTGDIDENVEREIVEEHPDLDCDVLKVSHHGSRYASASEFLAVVQPELAVIQCGVNNYGHPAPEALERLHGSGATVYTTREDGTVGLSWDGLRLKLTASK